MGCDYRKLDCNFTASQGRTTSGVGTIVVEHTTGVEGVFRPIVAAIAFCPRLAKSSARSPESRYSVRDLIEWPTRYLVRFVCRSVKAVGHWSPIRGVGVNRRELRQVSETISQRC